MPNKASMPKTIPKVIVFLSIVVRSQLSATANVTNTTGVKLMPTSSLVALSSENVTSAQSRPSLTTTADVNGLNSITIPLINTAVAPSTRTLVPASASPPAGDTDSNREDEKRAKAREEDEELYLIIASSTGAAILFFGLIMVLCAHRRIVRQRVNYNVEY